ncbi:HAD hydrolase-like protein [Modestobacter italicus]|uniref:HAD hydrolase-like protein n=1 Tax=Modestobacter italicus (strain DSM 44449 / CECT 9708 / BC 501) TaxID=2732864 RepID=UPI0027E01B44|nr:HAD hydrolase-like protein [Modestobacter italicus]
MLFDLDGTLVDSTPSIWASIRVAVAELGLPEPTEDQLRSMVGPPLWEGFAAAFGLRGDDVDRAVVAYRSHYTGGAAPDQPPGPGAPAAVTGRPPGRAAMLEAPVYPGIPELLSALRADGAVLAVATSKPEPFALRILAHVGLLPEFASVHGATLDGAVRHKEQVVAAALAAHPDGERPVLIGDRSHDVLGARAHGVPCIGAGWGPAPPGELATAGAVAVAASPADVREVLAQL